MSTLISIFDARSWFRVMHTRSPSLLGVSLDRNLAHTLFIAEKLRSTEAVFVESSAMADDLVRCMGMVISRGMPVFRVLVCLYFYLIIIYNGN